MRATRLVSLLLLLQTRGQLTAADMAERLETSERQAEHLRQSMSELRGENERHQKEREDAAERLNHLVNEIAQRLRPGGGTPRS